MIRSVLVFAVLMVLKAFIWVFYRLREDWLGEFAPRDWTDLRVICILNHTSLAEVLLAGYADPVLLWRFARHGVLPIAEKTMKRRIGVFFGMLVRHVVVVTRQRDQSWDNVLNRVDTRSIVIILPEGRMKRRNLLDSSGRPLTVRAGIADILEALPGGRMLLLYNGGMHHIQVPGEGWPKVFKPMRVRFELVDIARYKAEVMGQPDAESFQQAVVRDLTRRRDALCPTAEPGGAIPDLSH